MLTDHDRRQIVRAAPRDGLDDAARGEATAAEAASLLPFADDSMVRRVHREGILLLGGGRALLLQLAHPSIAAAVSEHSSFPAHRLPRLLRTIRSVYTISFGTRDQAMAAAGRVNAMHQGIAGNGYSATDPDLLLWVLATLVDTALVIHELLVRPLSHAEAEAYYADMRIVGRLFGLSEDAMPVDINAFHAYFEGMVSSIEVSATGRALAPHVFSTSLGIAPAMWLYRHFTAGLLPPPIRDQLGMSWGGSRQSALRTGARLTRRVLPLIPPRLRKPPWFLMPAPER